MRVVHLYPFPPYGRHGGTLRLRAAVAGSARVGDPRVHWFDPAAGVWRGPEGEAALIDGLEGQRPSPPDQAPSLKRRLFPSTLWESGIRARRALATHLDRLELEPDSIVLLHTSSLAGVAPLLRLAPERIALDVYDLVAIAHRNDAALAPPPLAALRRVYARTVRSREQRALAHSGTLIVAGHADHATLAARFADLHWIPTPTPVNVVAPPPPGERTRIGLLGNFAHRATARSAELLLESELARDPAIRILIAGLGSGARFADDPRVDVLGPVTRPEEFYAQVACVVAPVAGGSGMTVKLAEAVLAGRPVITTALGASGYPPTLSRHFEISTPAELTAERIRVAISSFDAAGARADFERQLGWDAVVTRYAAGLGSAARAARSRPPSAAPPPRR